MHRFASARSDWVSTAATSPNMDRGSRRRSRRLPMTRRVWDTLDGLFVAMIVDRYEADTAFSFAHSLRRNICHEIWRPVAYSFPPPSKLRAFSMASVHRRFPVQGRIDARAGVRSALRLPGFSVPFRDLKEDAERIRRPARAAAVRGAAEGRAARRARRRRGRLLPRPQRIRGRPLGVAKRRHRPLRGGAAQRSRRHLRRRGPASGSRIFTICSVRPSPIFTSRRGSTTKPACSSSV